MRYIHACHQGEIVYVTEKTEELLLRHNNRQKSAGGELGWIKSSLWATEKLERLFSPQSKYFPKFIPSFLLSALAEKKILEYRLKELERLLKLACIFYKVQAVSQRVRERKLLGGSLQKTGSVLHMSQQKQI